MDTRWLRLSLGVLLLPVLAGCSDSDQDPSVGSGSPACVEVAPSALQSCLREVGQAIGGCFAEGDGACPVSDPAPAEALDTLAAAVEASCADGDFGGLSTEALVERLRNSCASEASSLAWRTFGGPQAMVWPNADETARGCLGRAHETALALMDESLEAVNRCLADGNCDASGLASERAARAEEARSEVEAVCDSLETLIAVDAATYVERAVHQTDCVTATGQADTGPVKLGCGPSNADFDAPRGAWTQIVVDGEKWGTLCGDRSEYAFWIRLAPEGQPLDRILVGLQGGGVCVGIDGDCQARLESTPGLFNALDDQPYESGITSDDPEVSLFANWTKVFLPYCNQDVFTGGGVEEVLGDLVLPRYGGKNLRAAVSMVRDVIWKKMDAQGGDGFRPDQLQAGVGGWSAGSYGAMYNYHWFLDDLQWPRTFAFPDAGGGLDNGSLVGVRGLGEIKIPAWSVRNNLPPYCFEGKCAIGPILYEAISGRLRQVPGQVMLILSNQNDQTQQRDAYFEETPFWLNTMRQSYCDTRDLNGIYYYYTSVSDRSVHTISLFPDLWEGEVDGERLSDFFARAVNDPETLASRVEEGDFVDVFPGTKPFPCDVAP